MSTKSFRESHTITERIEEAKRVLERYPNKVPIIVISKKPLIIDKEKYLVPKELTIGQFLLIIRKRMRIRAEESLFIFCRNNTIPPISAMISDIYASHQDTDKFLYLTISKEETFG